MAELNDLKRECNRCGHIWIKRQEKEPLACPSCKSPLWNKPRKNKVGAGRKAIKA